MEINLTELEARRLINYLIEVCYKFNDRRLGLNVQSSLNMFLQDINYSVSVYNSPYMVGIPTTKLVVNYIVKYMVPWIKPLGQLASSNSYFGYLVIITDQINILVDWYNSKFENKIQLAKEFELITKEAKTHSVNLVEYV